jgi:microcystin-dependent protein
MADPFLSEIYIFPMNWPPKGFAQCDGQSMSVQQNQALYALLGIIWGGNGTTAFNLPDLRGRTPIFFDGATYAEGNAVGSENVTLLTNQIPAHTHLLQACSLPGDGFTPTSNYLTQAVNSTDSSSVLTYVTPSSPLTLVPLAANAIAASGSNTGHYNMQPSLALNFCIATLGTWPSRND